MQAVGDLIGLAGRRSGHGLIGGAALALLAELLAHPVHNVLGHQPVRGQLAAGDRENPGHPIAGLMIEDGHAA